ncbi:MAG: peptidoglycan DD-metalloendopeptidase family protein [Campylobacter sp.]|nr:peptidoglycan DD-metalloendopeptidase family protein [Campylobacter sp.]
MRIICIILSLAILVFANTKAEISKTKGNISEADKTKQNIQKKLDDLGNDLLKASKDKNSLDKQIVELEKNVKSLSIKYDSSIKKSENLKDEIDALMVAKKEIDEQIVSVFVGDFAFEILNDDMGETSINSIISSEIFKSLSKVSNDEIASLSMQQNEISKAINLASKEQNSIQKEISEYRSQTKKLNDSKAKQENLLKDLNKNKDEYINQLEIITAQQEALRNTLAKLKIIDEEETKAKEQVAKKEAAKKEQTKKEDAQKKQKSTTQTAEVSPNLQDVRVEKINQKVKIHGSSYQQSSVKKYKGKKTISPLKSATLKTKFGKYKDPVYNMEIFNEHIVLSSKEPNAVVYSVLPGKIVYAQDTPVLDKVVIIEHSNSMHTIYGHLSSIPDGIKVGKTVKKGYTIGRVTRDLTFEVTWKKDHINPLDLITLR